MLVGEGRAHHWLKTANWENPEKSLELQPTNLFYYHIAWAVARELHQAILELFQSLLVGTKSSLAHKNLMKLFIMTITIDLRFFKTKFGLVFLQLLISPR